MASDTNSPNMADLTTARALEFLLFILPHTLRAEVRLPAIFSDHLVLMRVKIRLPANDRKSTTSRRMFSTMVPPAFLITLPPVSSTISTRVCTSRPPPTRKLAQGCVTSKLADVSRPVPLSPAFS